MAKEGQEKTTPDRNASPSANGWFFQISAGIFLFLKGIKENKSLNIEGEKEDIEIETEHGLVYAQAKSLFNINSRSSVYSHYRKTLHSFKDHADKAVKLIYISNIEDPFNDNEKRLYTFDTEFPFSQLKDKTKQKIKRILGDDFDYDKIDVIIKHFYGSFESKKKLLMEEISRVLIDAVGNDAFKFSIYDKLITNGLLCTTDKKYSVTKSRFVVNMIFPYLENIIPNEYEVAVDRDNYNYALQLYQSFVYGLEVDYGYISRVLADYKIEKEKTNCSIGQYTRSCANRFIDMVPKDYSNEVREELIRIMIYRMLTQNHYLDSIKKATNLK